MNNRRKMSKRRRTSSIASKDDSLDDLEASTSSCGPTMRKRKKHFDPMELCHQLYEAMRNHKKSDGTFLCDFFVRVPKRRQEPGYYDVVTNPIDLLKVQQKLKTDEYADLEDLQVDIELIVNNTKAFYKKTSTEYKDAVELWDFFLGYKNKLLNNKEDDEVQENKGRPSRYRAAKQNNLEGDTSESSNFPEDELSQFEELYQCIVTATDSDNKPLHVAFQQLPTKKKYPEYYEVIEQPIDLKIIANKIQNAQYNHLIELERDLLLMVKNACLFNEPGSSIYKQAKQLKKIIQTKKIEVEHGRTTTSSSTYKSSERIRNKRLRRLNQSKNDDEEDEDEEEETLNGSDSEVVDQAEDSDEDDEVDPDNPQWKLFQEVRCVTSSNGTSLSEPFWRLPSRRFYPDYYREIKNPVSLTQIRRKLINRAYGTVSEVAGDLTIMFENAKKYNVPTSKLYKDAIKLQKIMQGKVQELLDIDQDTDSDADVVIKQKRGPKPKAATPQRGRPPKEPIIPLKKRLHALAKYMLDYTCEDARKPMLAFMEKPSKKLYSAYYEVIAEPIDFLEIESKIKNEQYSSVNEMVKDFKTMFSNCRQFNEENSPIFEDSIILEKYLLDKVALLPTTTTTPEKREKHYARVYRPRPKKNYSPFEKNLKRMYEAIRDYQEPKQNRKLSLIFMKLPSKLDYPDYYEVIKQPIDMDKISHKLKSNCYETLDELVADFVLMFDNACKYNEPDSQIYKDALILQRVCSQTKLQLKEDDNTVPDVPTAVQNILLSVFTNMYNHQDNEGHCYSDSMADLPEHDDVDGKKIRAVSLDLIKRRLDKGVYKRLDVFQEDVFACLERARKISRTDSQVFEDSIEMQFFFIKQRDELCRSGELLQSPALNFTLNDAISQVETLRQNKLLQESLEEGETETRSSDDSLIKDLNLGVTMTCNQQTFQVGDFIYLDGKEKGCEPHILLIERLWTNNAGQQMLYGNYYLRPAETYHVTTRKFLEKEVFKSDTHVAIPLEEIKGQQRCCVLHVKQFFTMKPEGFDDKDVFVCESRYSTRGRNFKKIKVFPESPSLKLVSREEPLEPKRVVSVFRERVEKHKDELAELQEQEQLIEKEKPNVVAFPSAMDMIEPDHDGNTYYEQYNTICSGVIKTGDFVYVAADGGKQMIAQIENIWDTKDGKGYFRGPWFITSQDIAPNLNRQLYKQELFLSSMEDTNPLVGIVGKCSVLEYNEYISCRLTEIPESDVFICVSMYDEINRQVRKLPTNNGLKKCTHSSMVTDDEIYFFPKLIYPPKEESCRVRGRNNVFNDCSPQLTKMNDMDILMDDSLDGGPPSVGSGEIPAVVTLAVSSLVNNGGSATGSGPSTPVTPASTKRTIKKSKVVTGYILYSREVRKQVVQNNPESTFGDISRIVGSEWKSLPSNEKQTWEEKASKLNEESKALYLMEEQCNSPLSTPAPPIDQIWECLWDNCDYQYEEQSDCIEHCIKDSKESQGHVQAYFQENAGAELHCQWKNCLRRKKNCQAFPNLARLVRHVRDMHINKGNGRCVAPEHRSKNFKSSTKPAVVRPTPTATSIPTVQVAAASPVVATTVVQTKVQEPIFISVPPRPQRVLHSEAYIKYIEGLQSDNKHISAWEKNLQATQDNTLTEDTEKLQNVAAWLGRKQDQHDNVVAALWTLRNQLVRDTLGLHKTL